MAVVLHVERQALTVTTCASCRAKVGMLSMGPDLVALVERHPAPTIAGVIELRAHVCRPPARAEPAADSRKRRRW